ncbi:MAG: glycosyltransferase [Clostridia bacterium]|nr:glycosyltransferase [Clostridia bacterium]
MNNNSLISVVVPIYKVEDYIHKCLDSIINQTYKNLEIILVDDGSPDNCPLICDEYAKKDSRIKVIHKKNGGLSDARNSGIRLAKGQYIGFVDSDDYLDLDMFEYLYTLLNKYNADISTCGYRDVGIIENDGIVPNIETELDRTEALKLLATNGLLKDYAWNKLYKLNLFLDNRIEYPSGKVMEDIATTYKLIEKSNKVVLGNRCLYNYLRRSGSITGDKCFKTNILHLQNVLDRFEHFKSDKELGAYYYKNVFYVVMRKFVDENDDIIKYIDDNNIFSDLIQYGKESGYFYQLSKSDRFRYYLVKVCRPLYKFTMLIRRKVIKL